MQERAEREGFHDPKYEDQLTMTMRENEKSKKVSGIHKHERHTAGQTAGRKNTAGRIMFYCMKLPSYRQRKKITASPQDLPERQHVDFVLEVSTEGNPAQKS